MGDVRPPPHLLPPHRQLDGGPGGHAPVQAEARRDGGRPPLPREESQVGPVRARLRGEAVNPPAPRRAHVCYYYNSVRLTIGYLIIDFH